MKKAFSLIMVAVVLVSALWLRTGKANAAGLITYRGGVFVWGKGIAFVFDAPGYRNKDVRDATIWVHSNFHDLGCTVDKDQEQIVCVLGGGLTEYAGETGIIHLGGQIFYVTIPGKPFVEEVAEEEEEFVCEDPEVWGATVTFQAGEGDPQSFFFEGESLTDVQNAALEFMTSWEGFFSDPDISEDGITCGVPDEFEVFE